MTSHLMTSYFCSNENMLSFLWQVFTKYVVALLTRGRNYKR